MYKLTRTLNPSSLFKILRLLSPISSVFLPQYCCIFDFSAYYTISHLFLLYKNLKHLEQNGLASTAPARSFYPHVISFFQQDQILQQSLFCSEIFTRLSDLHFKEKLPIHSFHIPVHFIFSDSLQSLIKSSFFKTFLLTTPY